MLLKRISGPTLVLLQQNFPPKRKQYVTKLHNGDQVFGTDRGFMEIEPRSPQTQPGVAAQ